MSYYCSSCKPTNNFIFFNFPFNSHFLQNNIAKITCQNYLGLVMMIKIFKCTSFIPFLFKQTQGTSNLYLVSKEQEIIIVEIWQGNWVSDGYLCIHLAWKERLNKRFFFFLNLPSFFNKNNPLFRFLIFKVLIATNWYCNNKYGMETWIFLG